MILHSMNKFPHPPNSRGRRVPGWEQTNFVALARKLNMTAEHLREALTGREGVTLDALERVAKALGIGLPAIMRRIQTARKLDQMRITSNGKDNRR